MTGLNLFASKIGKRYVLRESQNPHETVLETPSSYELYKGLWEIRSSTGVESIEIGEMDDIGTSCIKDVLRDFQFYNLEDESGGIQRYLRMISAFSGEACANPAGRIALLRGISANDYFNAVV